jgi:hypothetical protein
MQFTKTDADAYAAFYGAMEAAFKRGDERGYAPFETYFDADGDRVDGHGSEIINALLAAGWIPPD